MGVVNRVLRLAAFVVLVAVVLALVLPGGAVAALVTGLFTSAAWAGLFTWDVLVLAVLGVLSGEVLHAVPRD